VVGAENDVVLADQIDSGKVTSQSNPSTSALVTLSTGANETLTLLATAPAALDSAARASAWIRYFLDYDPVATARRVRTPVLILQGATDRQVTAEQADTLAAALRAGGNRRVTVRVFPETNHLFLADPDGSPAGYAALPSKQVRPAVLGAIADWLSATLK